MRHLAALALTCPALLVAACAADGPFGRLFLGDKGLISPTATPSAPCDIVSTVPAAMFALGVTSPASAGATVSLEPWVILRAPILKFDEVLPETFTATVDATAHEIVVSGQMRTTRANPAAACAYPAMYAFPKVATLSVPVTLAATGTYTVRIASASFVPPYPSELQNPNQPDRVYPEPAATRSLVIN